MGFNSVNPRTAMRQSDKLKDMFGSHWFDWEDATTTQYLRPIGPVIAYEYWWFDIIGPKTGQPGRVPKLCIDLDPYTDTYISDVCPYRASGLGGQNRFYLVNSIWRKQQDAMPRKLPEHSDFEKKLRAVMPKTPDYPKGWEAYQMAPHSESWSPVYVLMMSAFQAAKVADLSGENMVKSVSYDATDEDQGFDLKVKYDPKGSGTGKYMIDKGESNALDNDEMDYLVQKLDVLKYLSPKEAEADWKDFKQILDTSEKEPREDMQRGRASASRLDEDPVDEPVSRIARRVNGNGSAPRTTRSAPRPVARPGISRPVSPGKTTRRAALEEDDIPF
jgi:hypothetical protein